MSETPHSQRGYKFLLETSLLVPVVGMLAISLKQDLLAIQLFCAILLTVYTIRWIPTLVKGILTVAQGAMTDIRKVLP